MIEAILPREASTAEHGEDAPAVELHPCES
jgi:hypothetical protein